MRQTGRGLITIGVLLLTSTALGAQANVYSSWSNFPQSPNFFPIALWLETPTRSLGSGAPYSDDAAGMAGTKMNVSLAIDNGGGGGYPASGCGTDTNGLFGALTSRSIYSVLAASSTTNSTSTPTSTSCLQQLPGASTYLIGYNLGDEPTCSQVPTMPATLSTVTGYDSTRPFLWNFTDWAFGHGSCSGDAAALQSVSVGSFDVYPLISPWNVAARIPVVSGQPQDSMWIQGGSVEQFRADGRTNQPIWVYVDTGDDALGYSSQNGSTCSTSTNLCAPDNHEYRATAEQVNAEVWMSIINGAMGIEYFCDDTSLSTGRSAYDFCIGSTVSGEAATATAVASNLTYIDSTILNYAPELNSPVVGVCTMNTGTTYTAYTTSCTNGSLMMSTGTSSVPGSAIVKSYNGALYLFADSDRNGSATMTFTLSGYSGATAKVVYDSNAQYDPSNSSVGATFTLNSTGQFSDTFGANGHNYQPKIYEIIASGVSAPGTPPGLGTVVK